MAANQPAKDLMSSSAPETGDFYDVVTRSVQRMGGGTSALGVNLSTKGVMILSVEKCDEVDLVIYENGIWIPRG